MTATGITQLTEPSNIAAKTVHFVVKLPFCRQSSCFTYRSITIADIDVINVIVIDVICDLYIIMLR